MKNHFPLDSAIHLSYNRAQGNSILWLKNGGGADCDAGDDDDGCGVHFSDWGGMTVVVMMIVVVMMMVVMMIILMLIVMIMMLTNMNDTV